ncbi:MAG: ubiquinone/menaquinone biosynthesis methyltransferase [Deltaproteobacteria bacterium]|jgi:demethylmenaquinone methyltransferase/2-methoxy-6-polyprenyl-1,4-benzoquinol methylase|nr:ubiquinone/menaquinone biosynthesis methyltransferase [Deltaproteobacteria bacterium]
MALDPLPSLEEKGVRVRAMFDRIAPRYDRMNRLLSAGFDQRWRREALDRIRVGEGDRVVDLACGTGDLAELALARGAHVVGVDFALEMLGAARRRGIRSALLQADAEALPLPDEWATVATCGFALRNFVSLPVIFRELARVLEPGGRVAFIEVDRPRPVLIRAAHTLYFDRIVPWVGGLLSDRSAYAYLPKSTVYLPPTAELLALLEDAGFEQVEHRPLLLGAAQIVTGIRRKS